MLILACSRRKSSSPGPVAAIDRYDGPAFRVLRKYLRGAAPGALTVLIVSAEYGLVDTGRALPTYDRTMSAARARELRPGVLADLRGRLAARDWAEVGVCAGKHYRAALDGLAGLVPAGCPVIAIGGGLGPRLTRLRAWLRNDAPVGGRGC